MPFITRGWRLLYASVTLDTPHCRRSTFVVCCTEWSIEIDVIEQLEIYDSDKTIFIQFSYIYIIQKLKDIYLYIHTLVYFLTIHSEELFFLQYRYLLNPNPEFQSHTHLDCISWVAFYYQIIYTHIDSHMLQYTV